jgi:SAM-dependent methyltransferase
LLTVDFERLGLMPGERVLDMGCGAGRHAFEMYRRGADVIAFDQDADELSGVSDLFAAMRDAGEVPLGAEADVKQGDALSLPFADGEFDRVVASEVLEHIPADEAAIAELVRVLRPGGTMAVTVPRWLPEKVCWALSDAYHEVEGGHIRIYTGEELVGKLQAAGMSFEGKDHAHGLHAPYWWIKCAVGVDNDENPLVKAYHQVLVWDIMRTPRISTVTRAAEKVLNPLIGKSMVIYLSKPESDTPSAGRALR